MFPSVHRAHQMVTLWACKGKGQFCLLTYHIKSELHRWRTFLLENRVRWPNFFYAHSSPELGFVSSQTKILSQNLSTTEDGGRWRMSSFGSYSILFSAAAIPPSVRTVRSLWGWTLFTRAKVLLKRSVVAWIIDFSGWLCRRLSINQMSYRLTALKVFLYWKAGNW